MAVVRCVFMCLAFFQCFRFGLSETTPQSSEDPQQCLKEFLDWCRKNSYPEEDNSVSVVSVNYFDHGKNARLYCRVDYAGSMCMKNSESWYHCYPNKTLEFQGQVLSDNSTVDSDLCSAKNQAAQFQTQAQFNSTRFQQEFQAGMQEFFQQMARLRNELRNLGGMFPAHFPFFPRDEPDSSASGSNETESDEGGWENAFK